MSRMSPFVVAAICLMSGGAMAQSADPAGGSNAAGVNGAGTPGAGLGGAGTGGMDPAQPGTPPPMGKGTGVVGGSTPPGGPSAGMAPAPGTAAPK